MLNSLMYITTNTNNSSKLNDSSRNLIIHDWKSFFPGIFSSLYTITSTCHQRFEKLFEIFLLFDYSNRYSPVIATAMNCLLSITTIVISDTNNTELLKKQELSSQQLSSSENDFFQLMLQNVKQHGGIIQSSNENGDKIEDEAKQLINSTNNLTNGFTKYTFTFYPYILFSYRFIFSMES